MSDNYPNNIYGDSASEGGGDKSVPLSIHGPRPAVTRISRRAVLLAAVFGAAMGMVVLVVGFGDQRRGKRDGQPDENAIRASGPVESVRDLPKDYTFDVRQAAQGIGYEGTTPHPGAPAPATRPSKPSPQDNALAEQLRQMAELQRRMLEQQRKEAEQAMDSPLVFAAAKSARALDVHLPTTMPAPRTGGANPDAHNPGATDAAAPASIGAATGDAALRLRSGVLPSQQGEMEAFLTKAAAVEPYLAKPLLPPMSRCELKAGSLIPAALLTGINTDLPGEVIGQVTENVYDSVSGDYLLVPQGSRRRR